MTYLDVKQVAARYGVHRQTIWRWRSGLPDFPQPVAFGPQTVRWSKQSLDDWDASRLLA
ncbi:AlpA family transcriptional regulator [Celeribacter sp. PS-C1]|uniref:helix-turn-helix transcriptional regulator n=1 Tax=Celeribacter sp. PS-C1 TaxID=2820813 RepID=UPI001CA5A41F|nr:AlpA family phage regulatory protein [Celeribacter sp. PS-C1]MBW6419505.1 AlpA family phage regulatory protein [Celeribacter sp. PS-C1]